MHRAGLRAAHGLVAPICLVAGSLSAQPIEVDFIAATAAHGYAVRAYEAIWDEYGERIAAALETRTCLPFHEAHVLAVIADAVSHSGGPEHPMRLRATYAPEMKQSTLVHELGHRHLWQLEERPEAIDGHKALYLVLDHVWADVWGKPFAEERVRDESGWRADYDYAAAWSWARALGPAERSRLWNELLVMNGFSGDCRTLSD